MRKIIIILIIAFIFVGFYTVNKEVLPELMDANELVQLSSSNNDFSFHLFNQVMEDENIFISPYSIHTALLLAYIGAENETKEEMAEVLRVVGIDEEEVKEKVLGLKHYLEHVSNKTEVSIANAFFLREGIPFLEKYKRDGEEYFEAEIGLLPQTGREINEWVSDKTNGKIEELIEDGPISVNVIAYLVNAIYFKGVWEMEFDKDKTTERVFYGKEEAEVEMMENEGEYFYNMNEEIKAVTLKYNNGDYLFHAFMPTNGSLADFYKGIDSFEEIKPTHKGEIVLRLPKFKMEEKFKLSDTLQIMGMESAFDRSLADFSVMVDLQKTFPNNVYIGEVYHSSFIEVDEKGTEAAAATAVEMRLESVPMEPMVIEFNQPFFFVIEEAKTGVILFMGQVVEF